MQLSPIIDKSSLAARMTMASPLVHNTVDIKSAHTVEEKLLGFNINGEGDILGIFTLDLNA